MWCYSPSAKPVICADHKWTGTKCKFDLRKAPTVYGESVKCKMTRFRGYTEKQLADPNVKLDYALIKVEFAAIAHEHYFVADLNAVRFVNQEMTVNASKGKGNQSCWDRNWLVFPGDFKELVDISKIINVVEVINQIGKVFNAKET